MRFLKKAIIFSSLILCPSCYSYILLDASNIERAGWIRLREDGLKGFLEYETSAKGTSADKSFPHGKIFLEGEIPFGYALEIRNENLINFIFFSPKFWRWLHSKNSKKVGLDSFATFVVAEQR